MTSGNYQSTNSTDHQGNGGGRGHEAAYGQRVRRWVRGRWASGRLLARRTLRRGGPALALGVVLLSGLLGQLAAAGLGKVPVVHAQGAAANSQGGANVFHPSNDHGRTPAPRHGVPQHYTPPAFSPIQRQLNVTMKPADLALTPGMAAHLLSSDGRLEVNVPAGAVPAALVSQAGGKLTLHVEQLAGPSGGTDSGDVSLGTYRFTLMGERGPVAASLAQPIQLGLHLAGWRGAAFSAAGVTLIITEGNAAKPRFSPATLDGKHWMETAKLSIDGASGGGGSATATWNTQSPEAQWSKQTDTSVDLSAGDLTYSYPLDVPSGPGGLTPQLTLAYDSGNVDAAHNPLGTSGWLGDGWDLSTGSISWHEDNGLASCDFVSCFQQCIDSTSCQCNLNNVCEEWEDSWAFSDAYGNSGTLIPEDPSTAGYLAPWYDDDGRAIPTFTPINWHLNDEQRVKIVSYMNPACNVSGPICNDWQALFPPGSYHNHLPPCFRAFLPNGYMEEFGCTLDSLQFYINGSPLNEPQPSAPNLPQNWLSNYVYRWDLDMVVDPNGNQIHYSYRQVTNQLGDGFSFPIDAELANITYDSPGCHSTTAMCVSNWQPAVKIVFDTDFAPARLSGAPCPTWTMAAQTFYFNPQTMRCDDVHDLYNGTKTQASTGTAAPLLQSLLVLNDIQVRMNPSGSGEWQPLRTYNFSYEQTPSTTSYNGVSPLVDPVSGMNTYVAGYLDLTQVQELSGNGGTGSTSLPPLTMSYATYDETYVDDLDSLASGQPKPSTNCGFKWNLSCKLWSQTYNHRYLMELDNGRGWSETYSWVGAHNNTHGVNSGAVLDPTNCDSVLSSSSPSGVCTEADDENWSRMALQQRNASVLCYNSNGGGCGSGGAGTLTSSWTYTYYLTDVTNHGTECSGCDQDMYWGNNNDGDYLDYYNTHFMGFGETDVRSPDGSVQDYHYYSTEGYGVATTAISKNNCNAYSGGVGCQVVPWTDPGNALHGRLKEEDDLDTNGTTLLKQTLEQYSVTCPAPGDPVSAYNSNYPDAYYTNELTSPQDFNNPVAVCEIEPTQEDVYAVDGGAALSGSHTTTTYTYSYDSTSPGYGHMTVSTKNVTANNAAAGGTPNILTRTQYAWDDNITIAQGVPVGPYLAMVPAITTTEDGSNNVKACTYDAYDGATTSGGTGQLNGLTARLLTREDQYSQSCSGTLSGQVSGTRTYDASGNLLGVEDADALAGVSGHTDTTHCTISGTAYTTCATFDSLYDALPTTIYSVRDNSTQDQATTLNYTTNGSNMNSPDATNGWGTWLTTSTDANNAVTAYGYDPLGRLTALAKPGDSLSGSGGSTPTTSYQYVDTCAATGAQEPCVGLLATQQLDTGGSSATTFTSATYYDGWGRPVETVTPQSYSGGVCTFRVQYTMYDAAGRVSFQSDPYFVYPSQANCQPTGYYRPIVDGNHPGSSTSYDGLNRTTQALDAIGNKTTTSYTQATPQGANVSDTAVYEATSVVDANSHQHVTLTDGLGRTRYSETFSGNNLDRRYALYGTSSESYDWLGDVTSVTGPNPPPGAAGLSTSAQTTTTYDLLGRATGMSDADLGNGWTYQYDPNGNLTESVDPRGASSGTVYAGYDGLNRPLWRNTSNSPTNAYVTYSYDTATNGIGRLATESFNTGASLGAGSYAYTYDARGEVTNDAVTLDGNSFPLGYSYNDAGQVQSVTYSDGESFALDYNGYGWLAQAQTTPYGGSTLPLVTQIGYNAPNGFAPGPNDPTSALVANGTYYTSATYDHDLRLTYRGLALQNPSTGLYETSRTYDGVGNVMSLDTLLANGTDNQAFCYDEQNRLTWATSQTVTTPPVDCSATNTAGSITAQGAVYTATYRYDALNRLTSSPLGSYTYGASPSAGPLHAATSAGSSYTASYDAAGDLTCRAPTSATTCTGSSPTGQPLGYDSERRQTSWQSAPGSSPTTKAAYAYDGAGQRVAQSVTTNGTTTTTYYVGSGLEELTVSGTSSTLTKYESVPGVCEVVIVGSGPSESISYVVTDGLSSVSQALDSSGHTLAKALYGPYGGVRYSSGTMPTSKGYTGQYADATTALDYYNARYYDPLVGQFTSADSDGAGGLNRYAYVADDPETRADPSGRCPTNGGNSFGAQCAGSGCKTNCGGGCTTNCGGGCQTNCGGGCQNHCDGDCTGAVTQQCPPTPVPVPCATPSGQCAPPAPPSDPYDDLRAAAGAAASFYKWWMDRITGFLAWLTGFLHANGDPSSGNLSNLAVGFSRLLNAVSTLYWAFAAQSYWSDSQWTYLNIDRFDDDVSMPILLTGLTSEYLGAVIFAVTAESGGIAAPVLKGLGAWGLLTIGVAGTWQKDFAYVSEGALDYERLDLLTICGFCPS